MMIGDSGQAGEWSLPLQTELASPRIARDFVSDTLRDLDLLEHVEVAELIVSELVTNAMLHAGGDLSLQIAAREAGVRITVRDGSPIPPVMRAPRPEVEQGRGMLLVQELADAWGVEGAGDGKDVWVELGVETGLAGRQQRGGSLADDVFAALIPRVLHDAPAAVLLVDLEAGTVTYANPRAREMAPSTALPTPIDAWSSDAGLRQPGGRDLAESSSPLSRLAAGAPVAGEPVTAAEDGRDKMLWVTGFPLAGVSTLANQALVVLFEMVVPPAADDKAADTLAALRDRAVLATDISFTIADPAAEDMPLVWVNPAFTRVTGYDFDEVIGTNCRFLQGPGTDPQTRRRIRTAVEAHEPLTTTILNYRKDGTAFWNELALSPIFDGQGRLTHYVGVQADVTARVQVEEQREAAFRSERQARAEAERAQEEAETARAAAEAASEQMSVLVDATTLLSATLDVDEALRRLADLAVPVLADWCSVELDGDDRAGASVERRVENGIGMAEGDRDIPSSDRRRPGHGGRRFTSASVRGASEEPRAGRGWPLPVAAALEAGDPVVLADLDSEDAAALLDVEDITDERVVTFTNGAAMVVPLRARRSTLGTLTLLRAADSGRSLDESDVGLARDLARRAALALDNARLYTREHEVAETLQRSLLPSLPVIPGLDVAARYRASAHGAEIGGDWYDVFALADGQVALVIGDVMGHDLHAAAAMGQLRSMLRGSAYEGESPAEVLDRLDRLIDEGLAAAPVATALYGRLERGDGGSAGRLRFANAGHLPPLLREQDGTVRFLSGGESVLLGAPQLAVRQESLVDLPPGATLVLYTDGLVERRGTHLDEGLNALADVLRSAPTGSDAVCDHVLAQVTPATLTDDVALLVITTS